MAKFLYALLFLTVSLSRPASAQFTSGNITVLQVGDGSSALGSVGTQIILKEFNTTTLNQAAPVFIVPVPYTGANRLVLSGTATSEGQMTLTGDSTKIVFSGYDTTTGYAGIASSASATVARAIDTVGSSGIVGKADTTKTAFNANNIRAATRGYADNYWAVGGSTGVYYMGNTAAPAVVYNTATNFRFILAANNKLYFTTASSLSRVMRINSQPAGTAATADTMIVLGSGTTPSPYGLAVNAAETVVYVADDRNNGSGGIQKWTGSGTTWTLAYTLPVGASAGARSVVADWSGAAPVLYAVTTLSPSTLVKITDSNSTAAFQVLTTAPANTAFRSVVFSPKAPCTSPVLAATVTDRTCAVNGAIALSVTAGTMPVSYSWTGPGAFTASTQNIANLQAGTYAVTAMTAGGCMATLSTTVANNASSFATIIAGGSTTLCTGYSVVLNANTGTGYGYQWNNASGPIPGATAASYTASATGAYTVTVTAGPNCVVTSAAVNVTVNPVPTAVVVANGPTAFCAGGNVQLCGQPSATVANFPTGSLFQWSLNGNSISGGVNSCFSATASGSYCITVINSSTGCQSLPACQTVAVGPLPAATVTPAGPLAICQGASAVLHTNSSAGLGYQWYYNNVAIGTGGTDSTLTVAAAGSYTVKVSTAAGCNSTSAPVNVSVNPLPGAAIGTTSPDICVNDNAPFQAAPAGNSYQFLLNGVPVGGATAQSYTFTPTTAGTFGISVIVTSSQGCADTSVALTVTAHDLPVPVINYAGGVLSTTQTYTGYHWVLNGTPIPNAAASAAAYTPQSNGYYNVRVWDVYGCNDTAQAPVLVTGVGVPDVTAIKGIKVYPNPAATVLYVNAPFPVNAVLRDLQGRVVLRKDAAAMLDIAALADGVYQLTLTDGAGRRLGSTRIVKAAE